MNKKNKQNFTAIMQTWYHGDLNDEMVDKYFSNLINKRYIFSVMKKN